MVRPLRWCWGTWFAFDSSLIFQPFVPLLSLALLLQQRPEFEPIYRELALIYPPDSPKRRGKLWVVLLGCALMLIASVAMLPSLAMFSFVTIIIGGIYYLYGLPVTLALWQPLALLFLIVPPPGALVPQFTGLLQIGSAAVVAQILHLFHMDVHLQRQWVRLPEYSLQVTPALSGMSVVLPVLVLTLWQSLRLKVRLLNIPILLSIGLLLTLLVNALRLVALGLIGANLPRVADILTGFNSWILVAVVFYLVYKISLLFRPRTLKSLGEEA
jgi:exosortase